MSLNIQTIKDIRLFISRELSGIYSDPEIKALTNIIIKTQFRTPWLHSLTYPESPVNMKDARAIGKICRELKTGRPLQYILGETSFYNCTIKVNSDTLIPRPETEELVDLVIKENKGFAGTIADIGTGSGCIAIALAVNLPGVEITATDISEEALAVARQNASLNKVRVDFVRSDIMDPETVPDKCFGIIVSNPPYVTEGEKKLMKSNVISFEPHSALFVPDSAPLIYYEAILDRAEKILKVQGKIYFEINEAMGNRISELLISRRYKSVEIIKDINGKDRIIKGLRNE